MTQEQVTARERDWRDFRAIVPQPETPMALLTFYWDRFQAGPGDESHTHSTTLDLFEIVRLYWDDPTLPGEVRDYLSAQAVWNMRFEAFRRARAGGSASA